MTHEDGYKTTKELSENSGYSVRAIQQWCQQEKLTARKLGRDYVINQADWELFLETYSPRKSPNAE